jgi:hypothetical protein
MGIVLSFINRFLQFALGGYPFPEPHARTKQATDRAGVPIASFSAIQPLLTLFCSCNSNSRHNRARTFAKPGLIISKMILMR